MLGPHKTCFGGSPVGVTLLVSRVSPKSYEKFSVQKLLTIVK